MNIRAHEYNTDTIKCPISSTLRGPLTLLSSYEPSFGILQLNLFICMHSLSHQIIIQVNSIPLSLKYLFCTYYTTGTVQGARDKYPRSGPWIQGNSLIYR